LVVNSNASANSSVRLQYACSTHH